MERNHGRYSDELVACERFGQQTFCVLKKVRNNIHEWCASVRRGELVTPCEFPTLFYGYF